LVDPIVGAAKLDVPPARAIDFDYWVDVVVREHSSRFDSIASLKSFIASIDMLDAEAPDRLVSLRRCFTF